MRLLVLGGTGWLGRTVAETALAAGHDVTCLARGRSGAVPAGCRHVPADRDDPDASAGLAGEWDGVIDVSRTPRHVTGALEALAGRTHRWVFVSTGNVYRSHAEPDQDETAPLLEPLSSPEGEPTPESYGGAKVACEQAVLAACGERAVIARAGLIGGPGDESGRSGYWPWRFAHPSYADGSVLVPGADLPASLIDVRDLAGWLVAAAAGEHRTGTFDAVANRGPLAEFLRTAREVAGHTGPLVEVTDDWLVEAGVQEWSGPTSLPLWLADPEWRGFAAHRGAAIRDNGFTPRPLAETLGDVLAWEEARPRPGPHGAGLTDAEERALLERAG